MLFFASSIQANPFAVSAEINIRNGDWYPLPEGDMKATAVDTALAELTKGGLFSIVAENKSNKLRLEISLIGPAETAKLTIQVNLKDQPSYVSTASISVHDMDFQGIYNAFEHIGLIAAQRLNDKTEALLIKSNKSLSNKLLPNNKELQAVYDKAQSLNHSINIRDHAYYLNRWRLQQVRVVNG